MRIFQRLTALAAAALLSLALTPASAQKGQARSAGPLPPALLAKLNLTSEQQTKVKAAGETLKAETVKLGDLKGKERRQASRKAREDYSQAIKGVLNPDQLKQLTAMEEEAKQYSSLGPVAPRLVGMNLTDDQKKQVLEIGTKYQPELAKMRASMKGATDKKAIQGQMREMNTKMAGEVSAVLSPEQQKQFQATGTPRRKKQK